MSQKPSSVQPSIGRELRNLGLKILAVLAVFGLVFTFVYGVHRNSDVDMTPAIKDGDLVMFYRFDKDYAIGDLLLVDFNGHREVRRVVAVADDVVDITEDGLMVNGALQQELEIYQKTHSYETGIRFPITVGPNQVFVLGDARENATDSRIYGPVNINDTYGTVISLVRSRALSG